MSVFYYMYLLFIIIFLLIILKKSMCISAIKVKLYIQISLILFFIRYITLIIFRISRGTWHLYLLKPYVTLNSFGVIMLCILYVYIFLKSNNIDFKYNYIISLVFLGSYITLYKFLKPKISYDVSFGYIVSDFSNIINVLLAYLVALSIFAVIAIIYIDKKNSDSKRLLVFVFVLTLIMIENILYLGGLRIVPYVMFSDAFILGLLYSVIKKLNKKVC